MSVTMSDWTNSLSHVWKSLMTDGLFPVHFVSTLNTFTGGVSIPQCTFFCTCYITARDIFLAPLHKTLVTEATTINNNDSSSTPVQQELRAAMPNTGISCNNTTRYRSTPHRTCGQWTQPHTISKTLWNINESHTMHAWYNLHPQTLLAATVTILACIGWCNRYVKNHMRTWMSTQLNC